MNFFSHLLVGLFVAAGFTGQPLAVMAVVAGSIFPDTDIVFDHRRSFHFPVFYPVAGFVTGVAAVVSGSVVLAAAALFVCTAGLHTIIDIFCSRRELSIHTDLDDCGVYDHYRKQWVVSAPLIPSGSMRDAATGAVIGLAAFSTFPVAVTVLIVLSFAYTIITDHPFTHQVRLRMAATPVLRRFLIGVES